MVYLGADHRGYKLKEKIKTWLDKWNYEYQDMGNYRLEEDDDFPDFAEPVAREVAGKEKNLGVLICGSGVGMDIAANKVGGIRSLLAINAKQVRQAKLDNDANVLTIAADFLKETEIKKMIRFFLETEPKKEVKYLRRLVKIEQLEKA